MNRFMGIVISCFIILSCAFTFTPKAHAEGFALYEWGARGIALGGSMLARKPDASAVAYNPALIARLKGVHIMAGMSTVSPKGTMVATDTGGKSTSTTTESRTWMIPHLYFTQEITDRLVLGYGQFSRFGLGFEYDHDWAGRFNAYSVNLESLSFNPNLAIRVTDELSLAAGIEINYVRLDINKRSLSPNAMPISGNYAEIDSDLSDAKGVGVGANLAAHYQFNDNWAAGISYRSQIEQRANGRNQFTVTNSDQLHPLENSALAASYKNSDVHGTVVLPDSVAFGIAWTPVPELSIEAGAAWTRWSTFKSLRIHLEDPMGVVTESKKQWDDAWRFNIGVEYEPLDWLALRVGYVYDQSPMTSKYADYLVPTDGRHIYSLGAGFAIDNWTIDVAYAYVDIENRRYTAFNENGHGVIDSHTKNADTHITSFSLGYSF